MDLIELVLTVCLVSNAAQCRDEHLYFENRGNLQQCIFLAQPEIAKWSGNHPQLRIKRWHCTYPQKLKSL